MSIAPTTVHIGGAHTAMKENIAREAAKLVALAEAFGLVVTIERESLPPLRMGNHAPVIAVWQIGEK